MHRSRLLTVFVVLAALAVPSVAQAQQVFWHVNYFDNNVSNAPDSKVRIVNSGAVAPLSLLGGDVCAMTYVFTPDQQLEECCGCKVTPDALLILSVSNNLTNNTLNSQSIPAGVVKVVESLPNVPPGTARPGSNPVCDPASPPVATGIGAAVLALWGTHNQDTGNGSFQITETGDSSVFSIFVGATGSTEPQTLAALCLLDIQINGSGQGRCQCPGESNATATPTDPPPIPNVPTPTTPALGTAKPSARTPVPTSSAAKLSGPTSSAPISADRKLSASAASPAPTSQR